MPISMPTDTLAILGAEAAKCESRSLFLNRFAYPDAKDSGSDHPRRDWFNKLCGKPAMSVAAGSRSDWLVQTTATGKRQILFAQLQSRLMVNMAGGVMENAGLCLDRFGLPYIPGTAVKGCARRAALAALHEWCETGVKPDGDDNLFAATCASFSSPAEMLAAIARVFGWSEQDWKTREDFRTDDDWKRKRSDFAWACDPFSSFASTPAPTGRPMPAQGNALGEASKTNPSPEGAAQKASQWPTILSKTLELLRNASKHFAGSVSFLPAYPADTGKVDGLPMEVPELGKIELDVVTCHHPDYYGRKENEQGGLMMPVALDSEQRILPVIFPAIAPGHIFAFALLPLRDCAPELLNHARAWLATGLQTFGLGAKTAAGYGWFDASDNVHKAIVNSLDKSKREQKLAAEKAKRDASDKAKQDEDARRKKELAQRLARLTPEQQEDAKVEALTDDQFRSALDNYAKKDAKEQKAIVRAMRLGALPVGTTFKIHVTWLRVLPKLKPLFDEALAAFLTLGTLGLRATRGLGSFHCDQATDLLKVILSLERRSFTIKRRSNPGEFRDYSSALKDWASWLRYKLRKEHKAERPSALGSSEPRQASAVHFRPIWVGRNSFTWLAFEPPANRVLGTESRNSSPLLANCEFSGPAPTPEARSRRY